MISFISGTLLKENPCYKFMLNMTLTSTSDNLRKR